MGVDLLRIDDRLVHGQVVEGWLRALHITHVVVANDDVHADDTQKALYSLAVPLGVELNCFSITAAATAWTGREWDNDRVLLLVSTPEDAWRLMEAGAPIQALNVGGLHFREGRVQVLRAVSLDSHDISALQKLAEKGVTLEARPLPLDEPIDVTAQLSRWMAHLSKENPR